MSTILRALLGRWPVILIAVVACLAGGLAVIATAVPRYKGTARVILDYIRPDPTTGAVLPSKMLDAYIASQIGLIRDFQVTGPAVEALGFLDDPDIQNGYYANPPPDGRDLHTWIAGQVGAASGAKMVADSNILELIYISSASPELAEAVVDALRASYIESSAAITRRSAEEQAQSLTARLETAKANLARLEALQNKLEDETGIRIGEKGRDEESARLEELLRRQKTPLIVESAPPTAAAVLLRELDAEIAEAGATLGVNNPRMLAMRQRRIALQAQVDVEAQRVLSSAQIAAQNERFSAAQIDQQIERVLAAREPTLRLRLMQDEINRQREEVNTLTEAFVQSRTLAGADVSTTTPIGPPKADRTPVFPNKPLILGGSAALGLISGCLLALLLELMGRRIRASGDLEAATGVPVLGVLPDYGRSPRRRRSHGNPGPPQASEAAVEPPAAMAAE